MERMVHRVAEELGLDEDAAQVVTDENEIADPKLRKAKGWFDTTTGKITVVIPNHTGVQQDGDVAAGSGGSEDAGRGGRGEASIERKGDLAQAEQLTYHLSDEVDENGRQFVLTSDGNVEFGKIGSDTGLTPAPILLSEGMITNPETNDGYGVVHIEARHGEQIRNAGYESVLEFIEEVAKNYEVIREGKNRYGQQTYMLQLTDKHNNTLMVELSGDGTYWNINTAGIFKTSYGAKRNVVYNRHTTAKQSAETVEATLSGEQSGTTPSTSMNAPTQTSVDVSASKGSEISAIVHAKTEKDGYCKEP